MGEYKILNPSRNEKQRSSLLILPKRENSDNKITTQNK
jgi:hypothetical protein